MTRTAARNKLPKKQIGEFRGKLLEWYDANRRKLPWRVTGRTKPDPYKVWLSEIMLQQTTVNAVIPYYTKFLKKWPDVKSLADSKQQDVMKEWAGLGYYSRARNLHACAGIVTNTMGGKFPATAAELKKLPGIGDYTSAAITAIAFNKPATVVDGNIERIMARYFSVQEPLPKVKPVLKNLSVQFYEDFESRPGDLAQAFMDLGATVCIPGTPRCGLCPIAKHCRGRIEKTAADLPHKLKPGKRVHKTGEVYWIRNRKGEILLHRRPDKGLLGGMVGLPTSEWVQEKAPKVLELVDVKTLRNITSRPVSVYHSFTHFDLELRLKTAAASDRLAANDAYFWFEKKRLGDIGFPTLFTKALDIFLSHS